MKKISFENKIQKVQDIIQSLNTQVKLDELVSLYEEAKKYLKEANDELENAKINITNYDDIKKEGN